MNESNQKLYNLLVERGLYTKSYDEFTTQFQPVEKQGKLYNLLQDEQLYSKSYEEFKQQFFPVTPEDPQKKKDGASESDASPSYGLEPGTLGWSLAKFATRFTPHYLQPFAGKVADRMEAQEEALMDAGMLEDFNRYDFGDFDASSVAADAQKRTKARTANVYEELGRDEEFRLGLAKIDEKNVGDRVVVSARPNIGVRSDFQQVNVRDRELTQKDIDREKEQFIAKAFGEKITEFNQGELKQSILDNLTPEQREDKEFLAMLSDKLYYHAGVNADLDGDGRYNDQPLVQDAITAFDSSLQSIVDGLNVPIMMATMEEEELKEAFADMNKTAEVRGRLQTRYDSGITESYGQGDIFNGTKQLLTGLAGAAPSIAISTTGIGGAAVLGVSGGFRSWAEVAYDDKFTNDYGRYGYAIANGVGDFAFAAIGSAIFKGSQQAAMRAFEAGAKSAKDAGKFMTKEMIKGYAYRKGIAFSSEFLEEASVELATSYFRAIGQGKEFDLAANIGNIIDAGLIGGFAGVSIDVMGNRSGRVKAASNARANLAAETQRQLESHRAQLQRELAGYATGDPRTQEIQAEINRINSDIESIVRGREDFYTMMSVRHEADFREMQALDAEIERMAARLNEDGISSEERSVLEERQKSAIKRRLEIQQAHIEESVELNQEESESLFSGSVRDAMSAIDEELGAARNAAEYLRDRMGTQDPPSQAAVDKANETVNDLTQRKRDIQKLIGEIEQARSEARSARAEAQTEGGDIEAFNEAMDKVAVLESALAEASGINGRTVSGPSRFVGDILDINAQIANRSTPQWTEANIEAMENSGLTRDQIEGILQSENYAMITAENPNNRAISDESNAANNKRAEEYIKSLGLDYHKIIGRYDGKGENSFLVEGMTREQAAEFARQFDQESIAHRDGLVLRDGSMQMFNEGVGFDNSLDNFFSALKDSEGNAVRFAKPLSDKFVDKDGNEISSQDFENRVRDLESNMQTIEDYIVEQVTKQDSEAKSEEVNVNQRRSTPQGSMEVTLKNGAKVGDPGIVNKNEAKTINNLYKLFHNLYGGDVRMVIIPEGSASDVMGEGNGGLFYEMLDGVPTIHLSPSTVRENAAFESEVAKGYGKKYRTKSFAETVVEEVAHAVIGPSFETLPENVQRKLEERAFEIARSANDGGALEYRLQAKKSSYEAMGDPRGDALVREEVVLDLISFLSGGGEKVKLGIADKVRLLVNDILVRAGLAKDMTLKDPNSIFRVAAQLNAARKTGATFDANVKKGTDADTKASRSVNPFTIEKGSDGKVTVKLLEAVYAYRNGIKKDVGSREVTRKFNDKYHFVNWWKKATNFGADQHYSRFQTEDGKDINMSSVKKGFGRDQQPTGDVVNDALEIYKQRVLEAERQGLIDSDAKRMMLNNYYGVKRRYKGAEASQKASFENYAKQMNDEAEAMLNRVSDRTGKGFDFDQDTPSAKASQMLKFDLTEKGKYLSLVQKGDALSRRYGINFDPSNKALTRMLHSSVAKETYGIDYDNQSEAEVTKRTTDALLGLVRSYYGTVGQRLDMFGSDPIEFFTRDKEQAKIDVSNMIKAMEGEVDSSEEGMLVAYQFVKSCCSVGNRARPNIDLAKQIMIESARWRSRGGETYIDPRIIQDIRTGSSSAGLDISGVPGVRRETIADNLAKLNGQLENFQTTDGQYNIVQFFDAMNQVDATAKSGAKRFVAQSAFSEKVGAFALNLNGNEEAMTIDSHMGRTILQLLGNYNTFDGVMDRHRDKLASMTEMPAPKDLFELESYDRDLIERAGNLAGKSDESVRKKLERMLESIAGEDKPIPTNYKKRRVMETVIANVANEMGMPISQFTQLLFADGQVMRGRTAGPGLYEDFATAAEQSRLMEDMTETERRQAKLDNLLVSATNEAEAEARRRENLKKQLEATESPMPTALDEVKASSQLSFDFVPKQNADESPLYRRRTASEALQVSNGVRISDSTVRDALGTDATSRRILGKKAQIAEGQQVGVRLNLNVMKNTGVPVQTLHNKNATGEALRYAGVVTVKDPVLAVNQKARRKIFSFQENKFPMASVNGGFLTDKISESNFDGVKAFFNPLKHNVFVDAQGRPIKSAGEATIVGNTVYLRGDIEYYDYNDPILREGRTESPEQKAKRIERGPKYDKAVNRFRAYAERVLGIEFANDEDLREAYDNMTFTSQVALNESEVASRAEEAVARASTRLVVRRYAGRKAKQYTEVRSDILNDPRNYFSRQSIAKAKDKLEIMTDQELIDIMTDDALGRLQNRNDDMGVLASAEMIKRAVDRGDMDAIPGIVAEAAAIGTTAGRLLRHFRELKNATPQGIVETLKKEIEARGRTLSQAQENQLNNIASDLFRLQAEVEQLIKDGAQGIDVDAELNAKVAELKEAERRMDTFSNTMIERKWSEIGQMLIQGNLLTPMSQITNVGANVINAIGQVGVDLVAYPVERLIKIFDKNSDPARRPSFSAYMYGVRKFGSGFIEALNEVVTGQSQDVTEWRVNRGFMPFRSLTAAVANDNLPLMLDGEPRVIDSQFVKLLVQGTIGVPAEIMFRFLSLGDTPFRRMFEGIDLYQQATEMGLEGEARENFIKYPGKRAKELAESRGRKITFQEETTASRMADDMLQVVERAVDMIPGMDGKFFVRTFAPYRRTPANILYESLTFAAPPFAIARAYKAMADGDSNRAAQNIGKAVVGGMASYTAAMLIKEGLLSGPIDFEDDEERNLMYDQFPPNSINISGLKRLLKGEDPAKQPDDYFFSYSKLGIIGALFGATAKGMTKEELQSREDEPLITSTIKDAFGIKSFSTMSHMMDQSFLQGIKGLTDVLSATEENEMERAVENWFRSTFQAVSATALPNTLSALYRSHREHLPDKRATKDADMLERIGTMMKYTILDRTFGLGGVPVRVNWKGEPIKQTPRGTDGYFYQLFDITKARQAEADPVSNEIYRLFEQTEEITSAVGTPRFASTSQVSIPDVIKPRDKYRARRAGVDFAWMDDEEFMSERVRLNTEQINRMMTVAGKNRYQDLEKLINTRMYNAATDEEKVDMMDEINRDYTKVWSYEGNNLAPHTVELCKIINEIYEGRKKED